MINRSVTMAAPVSVAVGAAADTSAMGDSKTAYLFGTLVGTWQLQITPDGANWTNEGAALTAAGNVLVQKACSAMRWNCTAFTSGVPTSVVYGPISTLARDG